MEKGRTLLGQPGPYPFQVTFRFSVTFSGKKVTKGGETSSSPSTRYKTDSTIQVLSRSLIVVPLAGRLIFGEEI